MLEHSGTNNAGLITLELKEQVVEIVLLKLKETELSGQEGGAGVCAILCDILFNEPPLIDMIRDRGHTRVLWHFIGDCGEKVGSELRW